MCPALVAISLLWERIRHSAEEGRNLAAGERNRRNTDDGDQAGEQRVFDQVLALFIANERNNEILHDLIFSKSARLFFVAVGCAAFTNSASWLPHRLPFVLSA